ncbi:MAG: Maf family protein [Gammaproteobacteria bacterium]|jgi:septum formation protein
MAKHFIYLASGSPRRRELLEQIGVPFRTLASDITEARGAGEPPAAFVSRVAAEKADQVWDRVATGEPAPVLAADTAVVVDDEVLGKPRDEAEALAMLRRLSGRDHTVLTSVALRWQSGREGMVSRSEVRFRATTEAERQAYCRSDEPYDKAGAYAIQGRAALFVERLSGSYSSVMGLPLCETATMLRRFGLPPWLATAEKPQ